MPRPVSERRVRGGIAAVLFKPAGIPARALEEVVLGLDGAEAIRLADLDGLYQEAAARRMGVSRQTFGRILEEAHRVVADALINGKALRIEGGQIIEQEEKHMHDKVAVPTRGGMVASENRVDSPDGCGCKSDIASVLAKGGVTLMLAGNMGEGAVRVLKANGIDVIRGAAGDARSVIDAWLAGSVKDSGIGCTAHEGHDCAH